MAKQEGPRGFEMREDPGAQPGIESEEAPSGFTFASLVLSLSTSALMHLGVAPRLEGEPEQKPELNLPAARQVIDILEMLAEKTQGNLEGDESKLLEGVLHDLHLRFVEAKRGASS